MKRTIIIACITLAALANTSGASRRRNRERRDGFMNNAVLQTAQSKTLAPRTCSGSRG